MAYRESIQKVLIATNLINAVLTGSYTIQAVVGPVLIITAIKDTFDYLITTPGSEKIFLAEIEPSQHITTWTLYSGSIYYADIEVVDILSVEEDGVILPGVNSIADLSAGKWYHGKKKIYLQATTGTPYANTIVANYKIYIATKAITLNDKYYDGYLLTVPIIKKQKKEIYWGVSTISSGNISIANDKGFYDTIFKTYAWNNKSITILLGGEDLPYSEYEEQFGGLVTSKRYSTGRIGFSYEDKKNELVDSIPKNIFSTAVYPNLDAEDVGKSIPLIYGTVGKVPMICNTLGLGTATSLHSFKILDTSVCSVTAISQVYVNDIAVAHQSGSISDASFKLATATYSPGDSVTVSVIANEENPVEQLKSIASNVLSISYDSDNYNTTAVAQAVTDASVFPCGLAIIKPTSFLDIIGDLMKSCMGIFDTENDGRYIIDIWDTTLEEDLTEIDFVDITVGTFQVSSRQEDIKKTIKIGWNKNWGDDSYSYIQNSSETTEQVYGITKTKTISTLQNTSAGVTILAGRLGIIFESETIAISFGSKIQLAAKNIGDRIRISFKRQEGDSNLSWVNSLLVEINKITKDFSKNIINVVVDDLKGVGEGVGHWTSDAPLFPATLGGGSMAIWDTSWSDTQKEYARENNGYWTDTETEQYLSSRWW